MFCEVARRGIESTTAAVGNAVPNRELDKPEMDKSEVGMSEMDKPQVGKPDVDRGGQNSSSSGRREQQIRRHNITFALANG